MAYSASSIAAHPGSVGIVGGDIVGAVVVGDGDNKMAALIDKWPYHAATTSRMYRASTAFGNEKVTFVPRSVFPDEPTIVVHAAASEEYFTVNDVTHCE